MVERSDTPEPEGDSHAVKRWMAISAASLMLLALLGIGTTAVVTIKNRNCTQDLVGAIQERGRAGDLTDKSLRAILTAGSDLTDALFDPNRTDKTVGDAIKNWGDTQRTTERELNEAARIRSSNPLTQPRSC